MSLLKRKSKDSKIVDYEQLGRMLTTIYESGYIDRGQSYKMSFVKGLLSGLGGVIGATLVLALLLSLLSLLDEVPLIGRLFDNIRQTIESRPAR